MTTEWTTFAIFRSSWMQHDPINAKRYSANDGGGVLEVRADEVAHTLEARIDGKGPIPVSRGFWYRSVCGMEFIWGSIPEDEFLDACDRVGLQKSAAAGSGPRLSRQVSGDFMVTQERNEVSRMRSTGFAGCSAIPACGIEKEEFGSE